MNSYQLAACFGGEDNIGVVVVAFGMILVMAAMCAQDIRAAVAFVWRRLQRRRAREREALDLRYGKAWLADGYRPARPSERVLRVRGQVDKQNGLGSGSATL